MCPMRTDRAFSLPYPAPITNPRRFIAPTTSGPVRPGGRSRQVTVGERKPSGARTDSSAPVRSRVAPAHSAHLRAIAACRAQRPSTPSAAMWRNCSARE